MRRESDVLAETTPVHGRDRALPAAETRLPATGRGRALPGPVEPTGQAPWLLRGLAPWAPRPDLTDANLAAATARA